MSASQGEHFYVVFFTYSGTLIRFSWAQRISTPSRPHWLTDFGGWRAGRVGPPGTMGTQQPSPGLRRLEAELSEVSEELWTKVYRWDEENF